jgi:hypothetical protein
VNNVHQSAQERTQEMLNEYEAGTSMAEIGEKFGITKQRVSQIFKKRGIYIAPSRRGRRAVDQETTQKYVAEAIKLGSKSQAAKTFGVSPDTIARALRRAGVKISTGKFTGEKVKADIISRYHSGEGLREIAEVYGTKAQHVNSLLRKWGVEAKRAALWKKGTSHKGGVKANREGRDALMKDTKVMPGSPPVGVEEGALFASRNELSDSGVHGVRMQGIWTSEGRVIGIVLNGGYEDDEDNGDVVVYTGDGGRDPNSGKQIDDQEFTAGNRGLVIACALKTPIRVTRGWRCKSDLAPKSGFQYGGLYDVASYEYVQGSEGFFVWRFTLQKHGTSIAETDTEQIDRAGTDSLLASLLGEEPPMALHLDDEAPTSRIFEFQPLHFTGSGNEVIRIDLPEGLHSSSGKGAAILLRWRQYGEWDSAVNETVYTPSFRVNFITAGGTISSARLWEFYGYEGSRVLVFEDAPVAMEVVTNARWSIQIDDLLNCSTITTDQSGSCSNVFRFGEYTSGAKIVRALSAETKIEDVSYSGEFSVKAYGRYQEGSDEVSARDLMESSYGDSEMFSGSRVLPKGTILVEVLAPGRKWALYLEDL